MKMNSDQRILLFGGTTEGRLMARKLSSLGFFVTVCVATETGAEYLKMIPNLRILTGRMDSGQMASLMLEGYTCCIDATHPYAVKASASIREAGLQSGLPCYRLLRREMSGEETRGRVREMVRAFLLSHPGYTSRNEAAPPDVQASDPGAADHLSVCFCSSARHACRLLLDSMDPPDAVDSGKTGEKETPGGEKDPILLTTGAKEASCFTPLLERGTCPVFVRVLPVQESIRACLEAGFAAESILTGRGPFSVEENVRIIREHGIRILVTKDGGIEGGYLEKLASAALCQVRVIVIRRPKEEGLSEEEILRRLS